MHVCSLLLRQLAVILLAAVTIVVQTAPGNAPDDQDRNLAGKKLGVSAWVIFRLVRKGSVCNA